MSHRGRVITAWALGGLTLAMAAGTVVFALLGAADREALDGLPFFVASALVGSLIASRPSGNLVGWLLLGGGLSFALMEFTGSYARYGLVVQPGALPGANAAAWPQTWLWIPGGTLLYLLLPFYFPSGRLLSPRWRWFPRAIVLAAVAMAFVAAVTPGDEYIQVRGDHGIIVNPFGIDGIESVVPASLALLLDATVPILVLGSLGGAVMSLLLRFVRSRGSERQQMKWLTYVIAAFPIFIALDSLVGVPSAVVGLYLACIPTAVGIAILRHSLYDIDLLINRTLVYGALTASVVGIYIFVVGYLGAVLHMNAYPAPGSAGRFAISIVATGVVAVLFQPIREQLQRGVNRLMYGERDEPYAVLARLGERLGETLAPDAALTTIVETVRETFKLPYAAIALHEGDQLVMAAASGTLRDTPLRLALTHQREPVGELVFAPRAPGETLGPTDQRLLADLARHIGIAAHNVRLAHQTLRLNADLQRSREQLVLSREEERRRLRRDLHDGLAPTLAALNLKAGVVRGLLRADPDAAEAALDEWRSEIRTTIGSVRRLAYELRPPILDELGLVAAVQERAGHLHSARCRVTVEAPDRMGPLPAAVEVAAFRVVGEALTNVERHAHAASCHVRLWRREGPGNALCVEVSDDGVGFPEDEPYRPGVGVLSMHERAAELGGTCVIERSPMGGTRLRAQFPVAGA